MASISFPQVSFDWLAELPATIEAGRTRDVRRSTLADLQAGDADSLIAKGTQLLRAGDTEMGLKLLTEGRNRKAVDQRGALDMANMVWQQKILEGNKSVLGPEPSGDVQISPVPTGPSWLPGAQAPAVTVPPVPGRQGALSPSEQILAAAEGPSVAPAPAPTRVAQAGGGPVPVPGAPGYDWSSVPTTGLPLPSETAPARPAAPATPKIPLLPEQEAGRALQVKVGGKILEMPPGGLRTPQGQAFMEQYRNALRQQKLSPEMESYQLDRVQRIQAGEPDISHAEWKAEQGTVGTRYEAMTKNYQENYQKKGNAAKELDTKLDTMQTLLNNPRFAVGEPGLFDKARNQFGSLVATLKAAGINVPISDEFVKEITTPVALREAFQSLANLSVTSGLGGLSKSISDADRNFLAAAFPALMQTKEGAQMITDFLKEQNKRARLEQMAASEYAREKKTHGTTWGMDDAVANKMQNYGNNNRLYMNADGSLTDLGKKVSTLSGGSSTAPPPAAAPPATAAPPAASGLIPVKRGDKKLWYNPATGEETPR